MKKGIIGKKIGMTQIFDEKGNVIPVTVIETAGNIVAQVKTVETDGYNAIQLGYGEIKDKHINKPRAGHFAKAKLANKKHLREFRLESVENYKVGDEVKASMDILAPGGGYIMSNTVALDYVSPENMHAWRNAVEKYGKY